MSDGRIEVAERDGVHVVRLVGDIRFTISHALNQWLDQVLADPDTGQILIDMTPTTAIDSTNLGVLARIARHAREQGQPAPVIVVPDPSLIELLRCICFDQLFTLLDSADYSAGRLTELLPVEADEASTLALVLEAHQRLSAIDQRNRDSFEELISLLTQQAQNTD
ncbi:STAS domain-containing protein [Motiliproteus sediminis]|uniref:STAS domain-containing protein n=1 Tax=Motiliproteus sediminis TaxID=1468178 RepID=UPI001AEFC857|nr:STAS domain-containing protein [Motiliproteus sediminis]